MVTVLTVGSDGIKILLGSSGLFGHEGNEQSLQGCPDENLTLELVETKILQHLVSAREDNQESSALPTRVFRQPMNSFSISHQLSRGI